MKIRDNILISLEGFTNKKLILNDIVEIKESALENNQYIESIEAPNLRKIGSRAFYNCSNLIEIKAPLVEEIDDYAFFQTSIVEFDFTKVLAIGKNAFEHTKLVSIELPKALKKIGKYAFSNNSHLQKVKIESAMTKIKDGMFENCTQLREVTFSKTINKLGCGVFKNCRKLNNIVLPEHLKTIETNCFWECESLKNLKINDELEVINDYAFGYTKLEVIILPNSIRSIGKIPFHMCNHLEKLKLNSLFNNDIFDTTTPRLKELVIGENKIELVKKVKKVINYNKLIIIRYIDDSFQIITKPSKYYSLDYFKENFKDYNIKPIMQSESIFNIYYWEMFLTEKEILKFNPIVFIALPPNINVIKAFSKKYKIYNDILTKYQITDFNSTLAMIKFITIFGGLKKKNLINLDALISKIGIRNITRGFYNTEVRESNSNFIVLYNKLAENYSYREINELMPFLYNQTEKVIAITNLSDIETIKKEFETSESEDLLEIFRADTKMLNYEWLDHTSVLSLLWGYILASTSGKKIDTSEEMKKVMTYYIKDEKGLIVATARAYYSAAEKYLLFNSIVLSQSLINKNYSFEEIKSNIIEYVLDDIEEIINFFNSKEVIISKVNVGISEKSIKEQLMNKGTKQIFNLQKNY